MSFKSDDRLIALRHILFTRSSLKTMISWVQYWILQGLEVNTLIGIFSVMADVKTIGIGGLGRMFPGPGSCGPGMNTKRLFSVSGGNSATNLAKAWNDALRV